MIGKKTPYFYFNNYFNKGASYFFGSIKFQSRYTADIFRFKTVQYLLKIPDLLVQL